MLGPDGRYQGPPSGLEFRPPEGTGAVLIAGDETAAPAICSILERLPAGVEGEALLEVATRGDFLPVETGSAVKVTWLARDGAPHGAHLVPAVREAAHRLLPALPAVRGLPGRGRRRGRALGGARGAVRPAVRVAGRARPR
ncbi:siderophore-interacting protein [Nonomuraea ferruginea]